MASTTAAALDATRGDMSAVLPNRYSRRWFDTFLEPMPGERTAAEIDGVMRALPLPDFRRLLDVCCGPARHAAQLVERGYDVTGVDRDAGAIAVAGRRAPRARFVELDQRRIAEVGGVFDAAMILWHSFGYFDAATNDAILAQLAGLLRHRGRLLVDLYNPAWFEAHAGRQPPFPHTGASATNRPLGDNRWRVDIEYADGSAERFEWELFTPDELARRARSFHAVALLSQWQPRRTLSADDQRYQLVLERAPV